MQGKRIKAAVLLCGLFLAGALAMPLMAAEPQNDRALLAQQSAERLNINTANAEQLASLPGIGPVRAEAILVLRAEKGRFSSMSELQEVRGIGAATATRLESLVSF